MVLSATEPGHAFLDRTLDTRVLRRQPSAITTVFGSGSPGQTEVSMHRTEAAHHGSGGLHELTVALGPSQTSRRPQQALSSFDICCGRSRSLASLVEERRRVRVSFAGEPGVESETPPRSEEHTSELQSPCNLVCRLLLEKKK